MVMKRGCTPPMQRAYSRHAGVIAAVGERFAKTGLVPVELHRYLIEGQDKRNVGDYQIGPGLTDIQAAEQIARAEQFLHLAQRLLDAPPSATQENIEDP